MDTYDLDMEIVPTKNFGLPPSDSHLVTMDHSLEVWKEVQKKGKKWKNDDYFIKEKRWIVHLLM